MLFQRRIMQKLVEISLLTGIKLFMNHPRRPLSTSACFPRTAMFILDSMTCTKSSYVIILSILPAFHLTVIEAKNLLRRALSRSGIGLDNELFHVSSELGWKEKILNIFLSKKNWTFLCFVFLWTPLPHQGTVVTGQKILKFFAV